MDRLQQIIKKHFQKDPPPKCLILQLPPELIDMIIALLPLPSQACLVLSCRSFFSRWQQILSRPDLRTPRLLTEKTPVDWCCIDGTKYNPRLDLLLRLEDHRWAYCAKCQRLHPRREFGCRLWFSRRGSGRRSCASNAGVVDICPCLSLTFRDRLRIQTELQKRAEEGEVSPRFIHRCRAKGYDTAPVMIQVIIQRSSAPGSSANALEVETHYNYTQWSIGNMRWITMAFSCPHYGRLFHLDCDSWVPPEDCPRCATVHQRYVDDWPLSGYPIWTVRQLGRGTWPPDRRWREQCRFTRVGDYFQE